MPLTAEEKTATLDSFAIINDTHLEVVDRSTLELYAVCPAQARFVETGAIQSVSQIAEDSQQVHDAFGAAIYEYVSSGGDLRRRDLADTIWANLYGSRPDVQPAAVRAAKASVYAFADYITGISPANILRWDGGEGKRSGQLSCDMPGLGLRITSEIDLLHASPSKELLVEIDYKGGHKVYTAADVGDRFQFAVHAWLVFNNYPEVNGLLVKVWNTRVNRITYGVEFRREKLPEIAARVRSAALYWSQYHKSVPENAATWPTIEKCSICDCAALCPAANRDIADLAKDEAGFIDQMVATEAKLDRMKALAKARVKALGRDLEGSGGSRFGTEKPKSTRAATTSIYTVKSKETVEEESEEAA